MRRALTLGCLVLAAGCTTTQSTPKTAETTATATAPAVDQRALKIAYSTGYEYWKSGKAATDPAAQKRSYEKAIENFEKVIGMDPKHTDAHLRLAAAYGVIGNYDAAEAEYDVVLAYAPDNRIALDGKTGLLIQGGDLGEAVTKAREQVTADPTNLEARKRLAQLLIMQEDFAGAAVEYESIRKATPDDPILAFELAMLYQRDERWAESIPSLEDAVRINSNDFEAYDRLAIARSRSGDKAGAVEVYDRLIALDPSSFFAYEKKATTLDKMGDLRRATAAYEQALEQDPHNVNCLQRCSLAYLKLGELNRAESQIKRGLAQDPTHPQLHATFGDLHEKRGDAALEKFNENNCKRQADEVNRHFRRAVAEYRQAVDSAQVGSYASSKVDVMNSKTIPDEKMFFANPDC